FSAVSMSGASLLLYLSLRNLLRQLSDGKISWSEELSAFLAAMAFATGNTTWAWGNTIEAYPFQVLSMGILLYGLTAYRLSKSKSHLMIAAIGLALGWSNHHLTMIVFTPFLPLLFCDALLVKRTAEAKTKKRTPTHDPWYVAYYKTLLSKDFRLFTLVSASITLGFYFWMVWRAQSEYAFMFGKPENLDLLFYHIRGGAYTKNLTETSSSISANRLPYFLNLTAKQFMFFTPLVLAGCYIGFRRGAGRVVACVLFYFLILLTYQLKNNQWASTDAYLLLPFMTLCIPLALSINSLMESRLRRSMVVGILTCCLVGTSVYTYADHDRSSYPVSKDLMKLLDDSAPKNSVILISDWTTLIQYEFYRNEYGFRPDLEVMNYDFKYCHYRLLPINCPRLYKAVQKEYDAFIDALRVDQPYNVANTGCDLGNPLVRAAFQRLITATENYCQASGRTFLTDPRAHYTYSTERFYNPGRYVSGCFSSGSLCDSAYSDTFLKMDFKFLDSPLLLDDPSCLDKMVDFQAMLDQHISFYTNNNDQHHLSLANNARERILGIQKKLRKSMSFAYKIK
ncbi:MAG: protein O-mannosyl-transferase family, partial [Bacteroidota bacterium]